MVNIDHEGGGSRATGTTIRNRGTVNKITNGHDPRFNAHKIRVWPELSDSSNPIFSYFPEMYLVLYHDIRPDTRMWLCNQSSVTQE
jgi:hypothetical protein